MTSAQDGRRSLTATAEAFGVDASTLRLQARRGNWLARASAHDAKLVEKELSQGLAVQRRSVVRQVQLAERVDALLAKAMDRLEAMLDEADDGDVLAQVDHALDLIKTAQRSQALMRTAVGLPTSTSRVDVNVSGFGGEASDKLDYGRLPEGHASVCMRVLQAADALNTIMRGTDAPQLHAEDTRALVGVVASLAPSVDGETFVERHARVRSDFGLGDGHG